MKRKVVIITCVLLVITVAGRLLYCAGYVRGSVKTAKRLHKTYLTTAMRLNTAFETNNLQQTEELINLHVWMHSGALRSLIDDPYGYFVIEKKKSRVASDEAYERLLTKAEVIRKEMQSGYKRVDSEDGTIHFLPPSISPNKSPPTSQPSEKADPTSLKLRRTGE